MVVSATRSRCVKASHSGSSRRATGQSRHAAASDDASCHPRYAQRLTRCFTVDGAAPGSCLERRRIAVAPGSDSTGPWGHDEDSTFAPTARSRVVHLFGAPSSATSVVSMVSVTTWPGVHGRCGTSRNVDGSRQSNRTGIVGCSEATRSASITRPNESSFTGGERHIEVATSCR